MILRSSDPGWYEVLEKPIHHVRISYLFVIRWQDTLPDHPFVSVSGREIGILGV